MVTKKIEKCTDKELLNIITDSPGYTELFIENNADLYKAVHNIKYTPDIFFSGNERYKEKLEACIELCERINKTMAFDTQKLDNSGKAALYLAGELQYLETEQLMVLSLNKNNEVVGKEIVAIGTNKNCPVSLREIFMSALRNNAYSIILAHNHPCDNEEPSELDKLITENVRLAGTIMNIPLLDHIIIGRKNYYSFSEKEIGRG